MHGPLNVKYILYPFAVCLNTYVINSRIKFDARKGS
jgi:hypothetical protein